MKIRQKSSVILLLLISFTLATIGFSQESYIDATFNGGNIAEFHPTDLRNVFYKLKVQNDGSIILAGTSETEAWNFDFVAIKVNADGSPDQSFADSGMAVIDFETGDYDDECRAIDFQSDGKIILAGQLSDDSKYTLLTRLDPLTGAIDTTFGINGKVIHEHVWPPVTGFTSTEDLKVDHNDRLYLCGINNGNYLALMRFLSNGAIDTSFGELGYTFFNTGDGIDSDTRIALQDDQKIIVTGRIYNKGFAVRFLEDGEADSTFGNGGISYIDLELSADRYLRCVNAAFQSDGKIIVSGSQQYGTFRTSKMVTVRLTTAGNIDSTYGENGFSAITFYGKNDYATDLFVDENDHIFIGGKRQNSRSFYSFGLIGLNPNGSLDSTFANNGYAETDGYSITSIAEDDDKIVAGGYIDGNGGFAVTRIWKQNKTTTIDEGNHFQPASYSLDQNFPNPFNPTTSIKYHLAKPLNVRLDVFNSLGQLVKTLVNKKQPAGDYSVLFKAEQLSSGVYFYTLTVNGQYKQTRQMLLIK